MGIAEATAAAPAQSAPTPIMCDEMDCQEVATHSYTWDWGASGNVCAKHASLLPQRAESLNRKVSVHPLQPQAPVDLTRDERIGFRAKILTLEAELDEAKGRGLELWRSNADLSKQVQTLTLRDREAKAQLSDAAARQTALQVKLDERDAEHASMLEELQRLRTLAQFVEEPKTSVEEPKTSVDGPPGLQATQAQR